MKNRIITTMLSCALGMSTAWAAQITEFVPVGQVQKIESVQASFDEAMVPFGDAQRPAPFQIQCSDVSVAGAGRWLDSQRWTYVFDKQLPAGVQCSATLRDGVRTLGNQRVAGQKTFEFSTGGPRVVDTRPYGSTIDEDQVFVLRFNGDVNTDSLLAHSWCAVQGLGEEIPVRLISGRDRVEILDTLYAPDFTDSASTQLIQCTRRLPAEATVQLRIGPGVSTSAVAGDGVASEKSDEFEYKVRAAFSASLTCRRENARAPCQPVAPISVSFTSPIRQADAAQIRLQGPDQTYKPEVSDPEDQSGVRYVRFTGPFPARTSLSLLLPDALRDDAGRELVNADMFPLRFEIADYPPLVKFASDSFGIIERFANVESDRREDSVPATLPLTLRHVAPSLLTKELLVSAGNVSDHVTQDDVQVLRWYARVRRLQQGTWTASQIDAILADQKINYNDPGKQVDVRSVPILAGQADTRRLTLPGADATGERPFEVIGVPVPEPGFHVLEIESPQLGRSLLGAAQPMYVRTTALVTNLGVHLKRGRDDVLAWVTTLDDGQVVPGAQVNVLDCTGKSLAQGTTDNDGLWHHRGTLPGPNYCEETGLSGLFVSARIPADHPQARGNADFSFVLSDWDDGIESWRFNLPVDDDPVPTRVAHTVFDRTLFRAGETVSMVHFLREQTRAGLSADITQNLPEHLIVEHQGSGDEHQIPLVWQRTPSGGLSAGSTHTLEKAAKSGIYNVYLRDSEGTWYGEQQFRVEEFKLPVFSGSLHVLNQTESPVLIAPERLSLDVQLSYLSGGPASKLPVSISALSTETWLSFPDYTSYSFQPPRQASDATDRLNANQGDAGDSPAPHVFINKQSVVLDPQGGARVQLDSLPKVPNARQWLFEASFLDPNGEIQTLSHSVPVWPAQMQAGIRTDSWFASDSGTDVHVVALTPDGAGHADVPVTVTAVRHITYSTRKRLVGGFYSYDNREETKTLGTVCEGRTGDRGEFSCAFKPSQEGSIELIATLHDDQGRASSAATSVWVSGKGAQWFGGHDDDRMDVIALRPEWKPGEVAEFQVRMPFERATALVAVEREGVLHTQVHEVHSKDPIIRVPVQDTWGPNVYVSVLALRGRVRKLPWRSLLAANWRSPVSLYSAFQEASQLLRGPGTTVDLAKPAFRFGIASIRVSDNRDHLTVALDTDRARYQVGEQALVNIKVLKADGTPAANGTVTFVAVDQALLELSPNTTWDVLAAMRRVRSYGVRTATAQMQVVGRRHYGRKALPAGGGGGKSPTRELLDTLLLWQPDIVLDDQGRAQIKVQLNDAITRFTLVAIADYGADQFGTGKTTITSTRDLQVLSGLPQLVRQGDDYEAQLTVRNTTDRDMTVQVTAAPSVLEAEAGDVPDTLQSGPLAVAAGEASSVRWSIKMPTAANSPAHLTLAWRLSAREIDAKGQAKEAQDELLISQMVLPAIPVRTQQSTLLILDAGKPSAPFVLSAPENSQRTGSGALMGGVSVHASSGPDVTLSEIGQWFEFNICGGLEQMISKAAGLQDSSLWADVIDALPTHLDGDGLVTYFPGSRRGNEVLTAYLLTISDEAQKLGLPFLIPDPLLTSMTQGLSAFTKGKITRYRWAPVADGDVRKLIALDALSRHTKVNPRMLDSLRIDPDQWSTSAVIDWLNIVKRLQNYPDRTSRLDQARQILRARMMARGTTMVFADSMLNTSPWLMVSASSNQARLILATLDQTEWDADRPLLLQGLINQQRRGSWRTSVANGLASLAVQAFQNHRQASAPDGALLIKRETGDVLRTLPWSPESEPDGVSRMETFMPWSELAENGAETVGQAEAGAQTDTMNQAGTVDPASVVFEQDGQGKPWLTISSMAAVERQVPVSSGLSVSRQLEPVSQTVPGQWTQGDVYRVRLRVVARSPMSWVMVSDAIPAGGRALGSGLGRDSLIDQVSDQTAQGSASSQDGQAYEPYYYAPVFVEQRLGTYFAYYEYLPAGETVFTYTVRLSTPGTFHLTPVRAESIYEPDVYGELPAPDPLIVHEPDVS